MRSASRDRRSSEVGVAEARTTSSSKRIPDRNGDGGRKRGILQLLTNSSVVLSELIEFAPCVPAETVKACALIRLHMMVEENALRSDSDSLDLGDMWRYGCPKKSVWGGKGVEWAGSGDASSLESRY